MPFALLLLPAAKEPVPVALLPVPTSAACGTTSCGADKLNKQLISKNIASNLPAPLLPLVDADGITLAKPTHRGNSGPMTGMISKDVFAALEKWQDRARENGDPDADQAYQTLKDAYSKIENWAREVQRRAFPDGRVKIRKAPTNQAHKFSPYLWAKIYPKADSPAALAFTVGIDSDEGFITKIDIVEAKAPAGARDRLHEKFGRDYNQSPIAERLSEEEGSGKTLDDLIEWSVEAIQGFNPSYNDVVEILDLLPQSTDQKSEDLFLGRRFWIEKCKVAGRSDRTEGKHALGKALWSPQRGQKGADIYKAMREAQPGDIVFHLIDNDSFAGVSVIESAADDSFIGLDGTAWAGQPAFRISLSDYENLEPRLQREWLFRASPYDHQLRALQKNSKAKLFYNRNLELNQGAYFTEAPLPLLRIMNSAYLEKTGQPLPYLEGQKALTDTSTDHSAELQDLFLENEEIESILALWRNRKNVIVQGPPGVGKSFAARRLARALINSNDPERIGTVQFHQSYSYEDFIEGFRPTETGFTLKPGKFRRFCEHAAGFPNHDFVYIIDEINRGNLSKILGELMLLIEHDKRDPEWAMPLAYSDEPFFVPSNVYLMGLMNTADRSLSVVDYALRRRFAFVDLEPKFNSPKFNDHLTQAGLEEKTIQLINGRMTELNQAIGDNKHDLGPGFMIGHSFFCSGPAMGEPDRAWYERVIKTEIIPLLKEYWFDASDSVEEWRGRLLAS
jgi:hypothetical protein